MNAAIIPVRGDAPLSFRTDLPRPLHTAGEVKELALQMIGHRRLDGLKNLLSAFEAGKHPVLRTGIDSEVVGAMFGVRTGTGNTMDMQMTDRLLQGVVAGSFADAYEAFVSSSDADQAMAAFNTAVAQEKQANPLAAGWENQAPVPPDF